MYAVYATSYAPLAIYLSLTTLRTKLEPGRSAPPSRNDSDDAAPFDSVDDALEEFFRRNPLRRKVEVRR